MCEFGRKHGLADAADDACFKHGADALDDRFQWNSRFFSNHLKGVALETRDQVFGNGEDLCVDGI